MLCYWILRRTDGSAAGLVRIQNDRVTLRLTEPVAGTFTLFSDTAFVPIVPDSETVLPGAVALLGTDGDRVTCSAAAEHAAPIAVYRSRLSRLCTISASEPAAGASEASTVPVMHQINTEKTEPESDSIEREDKMSRFSTMMPGSVPDSAREAQAFSLLLQHADAFYNAYEGDPTESQVQKEDTAVEEGSGIDLFSQEYPGARWRYVDGTDILPHYEGTWKQPNGQTLHILAVRGRAAPRPPRALFGFTRFLRDRDGTGYWLRLTPLP